MIWKLGSGPFLCMIGLAMVSCVLRRQFFSPFAMGDLLALKSDEYSGVVGVGAGNGAIANRIMIFGKEGRITKLLEGVVENDNAPGEFYE